MSMGRKIEPVTEVFWELSTLSWDDMGNDGREFFWTYEEAKAKYDRLAVDEHYLKSSNGNFITLIKVTRQIEIEKEHLICNAKRVLPANHDPMWS